MFDNFNGTGKGANMQNVTAAGNVLDEGRGAAVENDTSAGSTAGEGGAWRGMLHVPVVGALGIAGFVLGDHGYDSSMATTRAYMVAVMPPHAHDQVFVSTTLLGAVGGCLTSLLGFTDLSSLFPALSQVSRPYRCSLIPHC